MSAFVEDCRSARAKPLLFLGEAGGAGGKAPCIQTYGKQGSSEVGFCGTIGRRKRAVDALASTVPFFGVADRTAKERAQGLEGGDLRSKYYPSLDRPIDGTARKGDTPLAIAIHPPYGCRT